MRIVFAALATCALFAGCGKKMPQSADEVAKAFVDAVNAGDTAEAAELLDYVAYARANNEDWGSIPPGQQNSIIAKLKEEKAREIASRFPSGSRLTFQASTQGTDRAVFTLRSNGSPRGMMLVRKTNAGWKIAEIQ